MKGTDMAKTKPASRMTHPFPTTASSSLVCKRAPVLTRAPPSPLLLYLPLRLPLSSQAFNDCLCSDSLPHPSTKLLSARTAATSMSPTPLDGFQTSITGALGSTGPFFFFS